MEDNYQNGKSTLKQAIAVLIGKMRFAFTAGFKFKLQNVMIN